MPPETLYHRLVGWHAPALRRAVLAVLVGVAAAGILIPFARWQLAAVTGWDAAALTYLATIWPIILRADSTRAEMLARREDERRGAAAVLLVGASVGSLFGAAFALGAAGGQHGATRALLTGAAVLTVALSWLVINTVYTTRYADLEYRNPKGGIEFGDDDEKPDFRDFAYVAFTIGMCYQVSDTTLRSRTIRRTALTHALLSYLFGAVIVGGSVNLIAGLLN
ncbi:DUF1345 domain-containing protein [Cryptosporangium phraense]|uniref:DUF1345 domain-containing protein n=1 Tax=Cryptosporangium phraense TaxID=2593070 RepID=A0A545AP20_9ACTN|nr:DUF1345 domain-containing protein [Cryptosporangium phraense]TQS43078.1 DUF1345 domain-containing protein [Cryptosporangium phraense]